MVKISLVGNYSENLKEILSEDTLLEKEINKRVAWFRHKKVYS